MPFAVAVSPIGAVGGWVSMIEAVAVLEYGPTPPAASVARTRNVYEPGLKLRSLNVVAVVVVNCPNELHPEPEAVFDW